MRHNNNNTKSSHAPSRIHTPRVGSRTSVAKTQVHSGLRFRKPKFTADFGPLCAQRALFQSPGGLGFSQWASVVAGGLRSGWSCSRLRMETTWRWTAGGSVPIAARNAWHGIGRGPDRMLQKAGRRRPLCFRGPHIHFEAALLRARGARLLHHSSLCPRPPPQPTSPSSPPLPTHHTRNAPPFSHPTPISPTSPSPLTPFTRCVPFTLTSPQAPARTRQTAPPPRSITRVGPAARLVARARPVAHAHERARARAQTRPQTPSATTHDMHMHVVRVHAHVHVTCALYVYMHMYMHMLL